MGFTWFEDGMVIFPMSENLSKYPHIDKLQRISKNRKAADGKEDIQSQKKPLPSHGAQNAYRNPGSFQRERKLAVHASQIMTAPVVSLTPETSLADAWKLLCDRRFRHIPILSHEKKLIGIISDRDILREAAGIGKTISPPAREAQGQTTIQSLIKRRVLTASPDTEIREIARIMFEERIGSMPIVDEGVFLVGIITRSDILRTLVNHAPLEIWL